MRTEETNDEGIRQSALLEPVIARGDDQEQLAARLRVQLVVIAARFRVVEIARNMKPDATGYRTEKSNSASIDRTRAATYFSVPPVAPGGLCNRCST